MEQTKMLYPDTNFTSLNLTKEVVDGRSTCWYSYMFLLKIQFMSF